jgi:hypothetical protein
MHPSERHRKIGFDGLDAHADAWNRTAAHAALVKTKAGAMISELARQGGEWLLKQDVPLVTGADLIAVQEQLIRHGFVVAVYSHGNDVYSIVSGDRSTRRAAELPRNGSMCRRGRLRKGLGARPYIGPRAVQIGEAVLFGKPTRAVDAA